MTTDVSRRGFLGVAGTADSAAQDFAAPGVPAESRARNGSAGGKVEILFSGQALGRLAAELVELCAVMSASDSCSGQGPFSV